MEIRDLYNRNKEKTNETVYATEPIPKNRYILIQLVLIQNYKGQILAQKRSKQKGGKYALTSGHAQTGETPVQGIVREIKEELGIDAMPEELTLIHSARSDTNQAFYDLFYLQNNYDTSKIKLQKEEVEEVKWLTEKEVETLCSTNNFKTSHIEAYEVIMKKLKERE